MRNHHKFIAEINEDLDCYKFLDLTPEEEKFLQATQAIRENTRTRNVIEHHVPETIGCLSVIMSRLYTTQKDLDMPLRDFISRIGNEKFKNEILDELYLKGIELDEDGDLNVGRGLAHIREVLWGRNGAKDRDVIKALEKCSVQDLKDLGIIDPSPEGIKDLRSPVGLRCPIINDRGFIINGSLVDLYRQNIFTGTAFDGPEDDPTSIDYYGCRPDGYDAAGYDRYGFNREGIHKVTGMPYDERMFTRTEDGKWINLLREKGSPEEELDLLGFNHDGINPDTGFDRDGYWHEKKKDGSFSLDRSVYNDRKLDVHGFSARGYFQNDRNILSNNGLFANGTRHLHPSSRSELEDRYGNNDFDIDGFNRAGFNRNGVNKETGTMYDTSGHDALGVKSDPGLTRAAEMIELVRRKGVNGIKGKTPEEIGEIIYKGMSLARVYYNLKKGTPEDIQGLLLNLPDHRLREIMMLPSGVKGKTIRDMSESFAEYLKKMGKFYDLKSEKLKTRNQLLSQRYEQLKRLLYSARRPVEDVFRQSETQNDFVR